MDQPFHFFHNFWFEVLSFTNLADVCWNVLDESNQFVSPTIVNCNFLWTVPNDSTDSAEMCSVRQSKWCSACEKGSGVTRLHQGRTEGCGESRDFQSACDGQADDPRVETSGAEAIFMRSSNRAGVAYLVVGGLAVNAHGMYG
jgi:hypothetical protein